MPKLGQMRCANSPAPLRDEIIPAFTQLYLMKGPQPDSGFVSAFVEKETTMDSDPIIIIDKIWF
jgi:hypothetical protein